MKRLAVACLVALAVLAPPVARSAPPAAPSRLAWWQDARFGMFIHFGVYSTIGRGEWVRSNEKISVEAYQPFVDRFDPRAYDARAMARLAKAAGMKYAVMTAKHHDGFCLFDSKLTDYKSTKTPIGRDLIREFVDAFRAEGLRVGLYYSLLDWHHPDYPHFGDKFHPAREDAAWKGRAQDWSRYLQYLHGQVKELVTQYGKIDLLWFDFSYGEMTGEKWRASELIKMVRAAQPNVIIDNRLGGDGMARGVGYGDFVTPEQTIPDAAPTDDAGRPLPWETCLTLNNSWGYNRRDDAWKTPKQVVSALVNVVSKGGNLLLNIGPDGSGRVPDASVRVLEEVGRWMRANGASLYGAGPARVGLAKPDWGRYTQRGQVLYAHVLEPPIGHLVLPGMKDAVASARVLADGSTAYLDDQFWGVSSGGALYVNVAKPTHHTYPMPDPLDTVFALELKPTAPKPTARE
jgi:alpha-L-fucosidase